MRNQRALDFVITNRLQILLRYLPNIEALNNSLPVLSIETIGITIFKFVVERKKNWQLKLGIVIMVISVLLFLSLPIIPFLDLDNKNKITSSTIVFISAEVTFYGGGFLVGKELFTKYKSYLNPKSWFKKKKDDAEVDES